MRRSLNAVLIGTFTLRFSTGLTGALLVYYLADLDRFGAAGVTPVQVGLLTATFYLAELVLSPVFGALSDRIGHHKVMLYGPVFGAVAVILTAFTTNLLLLGGTRWLEGASTAASVPSILGYIAMVTANDQALRGRAAARFEGATLLGRQARAVPLEERVATAPDDLGHSEPGSGHGWASPPGAGSSPSNGLRVDFSAAVVTWR